MKILLLEDELMLQSSICEYLETMKYKVNCFSDGKIAQEDLNKQDYDLLILDINVPNIDGLTLMNNLTKKDDFTPTIFISADININTISKAFDLGAIDYLKKPFHLKELGLRIEKEVSRLKKSLKEDFIKNIKGVGYTIDRYTAIL